MITIEQECRILGFWKAGKSVSYIARAVGCCRRTVSTIIAHGELRVRPPPRGRTDDVEEAAVHQCEGCGYMIDIKPCIICRDRKRLGIDAPMMSSRASPVSRAVAPDEPPRPREHGYWRPGDTDHHGGGWEF